MMLGVLLKQNDHARPIKLKQQEDANVSVTVLGTTVGLIASRAMESCLSLEWETKCLPWRMGKT